MDRLSGLRNVAHAIALMIGDGPYRTADGAAAGYSSIGGASVVRKELIAKELIAKSA
jgi:hypothetical protein